MERLLAKLERRYGRYAFEHLPQLIAGGMGIVFVLSLVRPEFLGLLTLDIDAVKAGQVWRLVTYLFLPTSTSIFWILFALYFVYLIGTSLAAEWGALKFNVFYLVGMIGTTVAALITHAPTTNAWLNTSCLLAFATIFPDFEIYPIPFIPLTVKMKWLGLLAAGFVLYEAVLGGWGVRAAVIASFANYLLFFGEHLVRLVRGKRVQAAQAARRASMRPEADTKASKSGRVCAICGAREEDGADIRVCSCEKCGGKPRNLCLEHARSH